MRFISSRRVCRCPSAGRLFFRESSRNEVHCWIRLPSTNTSTIYQREWREERAQERAREGGAGRWSTYHGRKVKILGMTFCIHLYEPQGIISIQGAKTALFGLGVQKHGPAGQMFFISAFDKMCNRHAAES